MNMTSVGSGRHEGEEDEQEDVEDKTGGLSVGLDHPVPYMSSLIPSLASATPRSPLGIVVSKIMAKSGDATQSMASGPTILSRAASCEAHSACQRLLLPPFLPPLRAAPFARADLLASCWSWSMWRWVFSA